MVVGLVRASRHFGTRATPFLSACMHACVAQRSNEDELHVIPRYERGLSGAVYPRARAANQLYLYLSIS